MFILASWTILSIRAHNQKLF